MMFTLFLIFASQGSLALVPEGMWHNKNKNNKNYIGEAQRTDGSNRRSQPCRRDRDPRCPRAS